MLNIGQNAPQKIKNSNYIVLHGKNAFRFNFRPREVPQPENMHFRFHAFSGWGTSRGPKLNLKAFSHKVLYIYYSKKNWSVSAFIYPSQKKDFPLYFQILRGGVQGFFLKLGS